MIDRRSFFGTLAVGLLVGPLAGRAQESGKVWRIGFMEAGAPSANRHFLEAFKHGLRELGYVEGQNVAIVERWADGQVDQFPALLNELIQLKVDIIVVSSTAGAVAAKTVVTAIPVVFVGVQDPLGVGLVASLGRTADRCLKCRRLLQCRWMPSRRSGRVTTRRACASPRGRRAPAGSASG